jgi:hypothetical protein
MMKILSTGLVSFALLALPAAAETQYQSTMSGNVKIDMAPKDSATQPKPADTLTIQVAPPPPEQPAASDEDDPAVKLRRCGDKWNRKLAAYEKRWPKLKAELAYFNKWAGFPAQQPPRPPDALLTRESYRACLYECLGDTTVTCPDGWPPETADKK